MCHPSYEGTNVHDVSIFILYNNNDNEIRSRRRRVCVLSAHNIILYIKTLVIYRSLGYTAAQCVRYDIIRCRRTADVDADSAAGSGNSSGGSRIAGYYLTYNILYYNIILLLSRDNEIIMCVLLVCDASVSLGPPNARG